MDFILFMLNTRFVFGYTEVIPTKMIETRKIENPIVSINLLAFDGWKIDFPKSIRNESASVRMRLHRFFKENEHFTPAFARWKAMRGHATESMFAFGVYEVNPRVFSPETILEGTAGGEELMKILSRVETLYSSARAFLAEDDPGRTRIDNTPVLSVLQP